MHKKLLTLAFILVLVTSLCGSAPAGLKATSGRSVKDLSLFQAAKFDAHLVVPKEGAIINLLKEEAVLPEDATQMQTQSAVQDFLEEFVERNPETPNPEKLRKLLNKEVKGQVGAAAEDATQPQIMSLVVPVQFNSAEETFTYHGLDSNAAGSCGDYSFTSAGPQHNEIPAPGPRDNNTVWYDNSTPEMYDTLYFGTGPEAGVIVHHPNLGDVDLRGNTMANYYLEQSEGRFVPKGSVYPTWLQAAHSEAYYGPDGCDGSHNIRAQDLVKEVIDQIKTNTPDFAWENYDGNADGIVDNFTVIHAGMGQEAGGGTLGAMSIWSHASKVDWPTGYLACAKGAAGCPDRDIYVLSYSMDPENIDIGVIAEEFGHAAFGLPDIYTTDAQASPSNWAIFEAGSWNGPLGGMEPAPFPLVFRYLVGWASPVEMDYTTAAKTLQVGQLSQRPKNTQYGIKINLPSREIAIDNPMNTGKAWWSGSANEVNYTLTHSFDLTGATAPIFSMASSWDIEEGWDYGYVEVSTDGGATWTSLPDMDGKFIPESEDSSGNLHGYGLTGSGQGSLRIDLAAYAGQSIQLRLRYSTDTALTWNGWFIDDLALKDGEAVLFTDDVEGETTWAVDGWQVAPLTLTFPIYYMVEWRNLSGFDRGLAYPYSTVYSDDDEWEVDRAPYTVPGMLIWLRNTSYAFDYTLNDSTGTPPSLGTKHALLVVDSHPFPLTWNDYQYASGAYLRVGSRVQPGNATFTLQPTTGFTLRLGLNPYTGQYEDTPLQTKTFEPLPAVSQFHDSVNYYPGLLAGIDNKIYYWDRVASLVTPAKDVYTVRISDVNNQLRTDLFGRVVGGFTLGTGNPGDSGVQYGLHLAVTDQAKDGSWGKIAVWNSPLVADLQIGASKAQVTAGKMITYTLTVKNQTPVSQSFELTDPIPAYTTILQSQYFDPASNAIHWKGTLLPNSSRFISFTVRVNADTPDGTIITNTAQVTDNATGDQATVETTVGR